MKRGAMPVVLPVTGDEFKKNGILPLQIFSLNKNAAFQYANPYFNFKPTAIDL